MDLRGFLRTVLLFGLALVICSSTTDPDLWGHVRFGQDILASHTIPTADPYSFTSDRTWINHEWLAEVLFALAYNAAGALGLNILRVGLIAAVLVLVWRRVVRTGGAGFAIALVAFTTIGIFLRVYPIRPQLFSVLLFAALLHALTRYDDTRSIRHLMLFPLIMCAWANLHGRWIVGLGMLFVWIAMRIAVTGSSRREAVTLVFAALLSCAATLINPYGIHLWQFVQSTVGLHRPLVSDWQPVYTLPVAFWSAWGVSVAVSAFVIVRARRTIDPAYLAMVVLLGVAAFRVSRIDAFFALAVVFLFSPLLTAPSKAADIPLPRPRRSRPLAALSGALAILTAIGVIRQLPLIDARYPMVPELEAETYIRANKLTGRMLTWFDWGEYAIWHFSPHIQVSMDGRRETVYSDSRVAEHMTFYFGGADAVHYPDTLGADYVWIPKTLRVVRDLQSTGWLVAFEGPYSVILVRPDRSQLPSLVVAAHPAAPRYFPGP
jgi:hypothetical protein